MIAKPNLYTHHLARGEETGKIFVSRIRDSAVLWHNAHAHRGAITDLAWSPDSQFLASAGEDGMVHVWLASSGDLLQSFPHGEKIVRLRWSEHGTLASTSPAHICLWQLTTATLAAAA